jgi:hypothetical protein
MVHLAEDPPPSDPGDRVGVTRDTEKLVRRARPTFRVTATSTARGFQANPGVMSPFTRVLLFLRGRR